MDWSQAFKIANSVALVSWIVLLVAPRYNWILEGLRRIVIGLIAVVYTTVVVTTFSQIEGGGFGSLQEVKTLFSVDAAIFAGWIHYLAFDLFVGIWIAERADRLRIHRVLQVPFFFFTFMVGPLGLLLFYLTEGVLVPLRRTSANPAETATGVLPENQR